MKSRVTKLAVYRNILRMERYSLAQAEKVTKSGNKWERDLYKIYIADAQEYKELAQLVKASKWRKAFNYWQSLDTFVREGVPSFHAKYMLRRGQKSATKA